MLTSARGRHPVAWKMGLVLAAAAGLFPAAAPPTLGDVLVLKDGKTIEGEVRETETAYEVKTPFGTLTVTKSDVTRRVPPADAVVAEAETLRAVAKGMIDEAGAAADAKIRDRKLAAAAEILGKAAAQLTGARTAYPGDAYAHLDKAAVELLAEARRCRERMAPPDAPPAAPPAGAPAAAAAPGTSVPSADILAPPPPPTARRAPVEESRVERPPVEPPAPVPPTPAAPPAPASAADKLLADARKLAEGKRGAEARTIAARVIKQYPGTPAADEAQALMDTLPHPDGRLVSGFDSEADIAAWEVYRHRLVKLALTSEPKEINEGKGAARMTALRDPDHSTGAIVLQLGKFDETRFRGLSLWLYQAQPSPGRLEIAFIRGKLESPPWISEDGDSEMGACFYFATPLNFVGWRQVKVSAQQFLPRGSGGVSGKITWRDVGAIVIYDAARKGMDVVLDSLRFIEVEK